jgi:hypothetical protein
MNDDFWGDAGASLAVGALLAVGAYAVSTEVVPLVSELFPGTAGTAEAALGSALSIVASTFSLTASVLLVGAEVEVSSGSLATPVSSPLPGSAPTPEYS